MMITSTNPMVYTDFPDPDIIRVGGVYYMATTTMHFTPGCDILRSYDLVHWEFIAHALNIVADTPEERLECEGANAYGRGMWAPSLRYHRGTWYVLFAANDTHTSYLLTADDPCGPWRKRELDGFYYDSGLFFDDDDRAYVVHGQSTLRITELNPELSGPMPGGLDRVIVQDDPQADLGYEGSHLYKHDGRYYVFTCHFPQGKGKTEACLMAESLGGAFEVREIIDDDLSFHGYGVAQGGMVDTPDGDWYAFMMQDRGGVGRVPILMPMRFGEDGFPVVGENGKVPQSVSVPAASCAEPVTPINGSEFIARYNAEGGVDANCLQPYWQFNHISHNEYWSLTERPGAFRLHSGRISSNLNHAWNTLTQRTMGPVTVAEVTVDASTLHDGDFAGLAAFQGCYSYIALTRRNGRTMLTVQYKPANDDSIFSDNDWDSPAVTDAEIMADADCMRLRAVYDFTDCKDEVTFFYRDADTPESEWRPLGTAHRMVFKMDHFTGCRIGLFLYSTKETGGIADFYDFAYSTPDTKEREQ